MNGHRSTDNLVRMANSIGDFFNAMPDQEEACRDLAMHLQRYWEPRMRSGLLRHLENHQGEGLQEIVLVTLRQYRAELG
ncbi:formate dehydrogenase subunit delta [Azohydromonas lata]|uniref:Formate dehydrogenase subunit delta n=1 Tax=Azohydromonas lata TaxID=45677 RepID=A0ABU5IAK8_9BURK|nr:formate dehydrogenase subunit delta [Azohydromonas lata]MDZ5456139.1 formate dehydrogenase subunit delta [Azohydromonas lata]